VTEPGYLTTGWGGYPEEEIMVWVVQFTAENPPTYIAEGGGLTYQFAKAKDFGSKVAAEEWVNNHKMPATWQAIGHATPPAPAKLVRGMPPPKMK
jgi:hypothetical protein